MIGVLSLGIALSLWSLMLVLFSLLLLKFLRGFKFLELRESRRVRLGVIRWRGSLLVSYCHVCSIYLMHLLLSHLVAIFGETVVARSC
jgi:hypothetical protein